MSRPDEPSIKRIVCDCNVLFQAVASPEGPAAATIDAVKQGRIALFISDYVLRELRSVALRPHLARRFQITENRLNDFLEALQGSATLVVDVPHVFDFPRDPKDAHYVNLALAADARFIVSRDDDLLSLGNTATLEGREFTARFPGLRILSPPQFLSELSSYPGG